MGPLLHSFMFPKEFGRETPTTFPLQYSSCRARRRAGESGLFMESCLGIIYLLAIFNMPILLNVITIMRWFEMYSGLGVNFLTYRQINTTITEKNKIGWNYDVFSLRVYSLLKPTITKRKIRILREITKLAQMIFSKLNLTIFQNSASYSKIWIYMTIWSNVIAFLSTF